MERKAIGPTLTLAAAFVAALVMLLVLASPVSARQYSPAVVDEGVMLVPQDWALIPDGMQTCDTFRLLFVTSTKGDASSPDIADYNGFVREDASMGHADIRVYKDHFRALASTEETDARDNTGTNPNVNGAGEPIYWLNGPRIADGYVDFYDGAWDHTNPGRLPAGKAVEFADDELVFTGSECDGTAAFAPLGGSETEGVSYTTAAELGKDGALTPSATAGLFDSLRFYGISGVFQVADATPIPVGLRFRVHGELTDSRGRDLFSVPVMAGKDYIIELTNRMQFNGDGDPLYVSGHLVDPSILEVVDTSGLQALGEHDHGGFTANFARAFFRPESSGTYYIAVGAGREDRTGVGHYTLSVRVDDHADDYRTAPGVVLRPGQAVTASIDSDVAPNDPDLNRWAWLEDAGLGNGLWPRRGIESLDDRDVFRFEIDDEGFYELAVANQPTGVGIWLVRDEGGELFNSEHNAPAETIVGHYESGTYFVEVGTPYESSGNVGPYTETLEKTDP